MTSREFVDYLYRKYHHELEGPVIAVRKSLAELDPQSPAFIALMQRQAKERGIDVDKILANFRQSGTALPR